VGAPALLSGIDLGLAARFIADSLVAALIAPSCERYAERAAAKRRNVASDRRGGAVVGIGGVREEDGVGVA
jgi:hypothetical protein